MNKFRWAYIDCGSIAKNTARSITRGGQEITAVFSRTFEKAKVFAGAYHAKAYQSIDELLADDCYDAVYIATPHNSHADYAVRAMEAGKTESAFVPQQATRDCMRVMDECRRQLGLKYPFE